jgi:hypothetical protein
MGWKVWNLLDVIKPKYEVLYLHIHCVIPRNSVYRSQGCQEIRPYDSNDRRLIFREIGAKAVPPITLKYFQMRYVCYSCLPVGGALQ